MNYTWLSCIPPVIVLILGFTTRHVMISLISGLISAAYIAADFSLWGTVVTIARRVWTNMELYTFTSITAVWNGWNALIFVFLLALGVFVTLVVHSGGARACGNLARRYIHSSKSVQIATMCLSLLFFIDDYYSSLMVGAIMQPLTDQFRVPRVKLAFLVDAMAAPLAVLCPISSWLAATVGFLHENGISDQAGPHISIVAHPFSVYLNMIPFLFYSGIIVAAVCFILLYPISFGRMRRHEEHMIQPDVQASTDTTIDGNADTSYDVNASLFDFLAPVCILLFCVIAGMLLSGEYMMISGTRSFTQALQHANAAVALCFGGVTALLICTLMYLWRGKIRLTQIPHVFGKGMHLMISAIIVLILAWTMGDILREDLKTGQYLALFMHNVVSVPFLPCMFFAVSLATSFAIGSSWGTVSLFIPIAIPMLIALQDVSVPVSIDTVSMLFPLLGAIFSGSVAGDHISPISDTTVMSSTSTGANHIEHVATQMTYTLPVIAGVCAAFALVGILMPYGIYTAAGASLAVGIIVTISLLILAHNWSHRSSR